MFSSFSPRCQLCFPPFLLGDSLCFVVIVRRSSTTERVIELTQRSTQLSQASRSLSHSLTLSLSPSLSPSLTPSLTPSLPHSLPPSLLPPSSSLPPSPSSLPPSLPPSLQSCRSIRRDSRERGGLKPASDLFRATPSSVRDAEFQSKRTVRESEHHTF